MGNEVAHLFVVMSFNAADLEDRRYKADEADRVHYVPKQDIRHFVNLGRAAKGFIARELNKGNAIRMFVIGFPEREVHEIKVTMTKKGRVAELQFNPIN